ncbi:hypothetical protein [Flavobacterium sp.]|uniref:hypothetical protein n=1 Tax=Flavobacterium sp. TaxID=239 RepID=UPI002B4AB1C0|nr:hypothetical protein [Flavobacterium sp.]HLF53149.1 hypothetical protein [Flavobacterium sp.]
MKKNVYLFVTLFTIISFSCSSDNSNNDNPVEPDPVFDCNYHGNVVLTTQAEVNSFASFGYCRIIDGHLIIGNSTSESNIGSLSGLSTITKLNGNVIIINNPLLTTLQGLHNITDASYIEIKNNNSLINLTGFGSVVNFSGNSTGFHLISNASLQNLEGLENMQNIPTIQIDNCPSFNSLHGLENCTSLQNLEITSCPLLTNLVPLANLEQLGTLKMWDNESFTSLQGLNNVTEMDQLELKNNQALVSLDGLDNLTVLVGLSCIQNHSLTTLGGLEHITKIHNINITSNNGLISLSGLQNVTETADLKINYNNALTSIAHLSSLIKIDAYFSGLSYIGGLDINLNPSLLSLNGLQNITLFRGDLYVTNNNSLTGLCAILNSIQTGTIQYMYVYNNANPVTSSLLNLGNCN